MSTARRNAVFVALIVGLLVLALAGQAGADAIVSGASGTSTNRAVGRAASSYLTGLKVVAAAALWNRADPIMHRYYKHVPLQQQGFIMTSIALVQTLDPHLVQSYYTGSWILIQNGAIEEGIAMAERGVEANPDAGILWINLAQLRQLYGDDSEGAVEAGQVVLARAQDMQWTDLVEKHNAYPILGAIFRQAGRDDLNDVVQAELAVLDAEAGDDLTSEDHDHDHDGKPDH